MKQLLVAAGWVDRLTDFFALLAKWAVLLCACLSAGNAIMRYAF
jgi:TRAP-type mannitol/chloroaromatic compound transport system permease small subunit